MTFFFITLSAPVVTLLISAVLVTFIACGTILVEKNANPKLKWLMFAIFYSLISYYYVNVLVITGFIGHVPFFLRGLTPFYYIIQPAIYFYVVINLNDNYTFSKIDLLHLIPVLYAIIDNWGFYSGGPQHWQYWANLISIEYTKIANYQGT
jgi:hypothetical protein